MRELERAQAFTRKMMYDETTSSHGGVKDGSVARANAVVVLSDLVPVDDIPESGNVLRATVLVLEVVGMLPYIEAKDGGSGLFDNTGHEGILLVLGGGDEKLTIGTDR